MISRAADVAPTINSIRQVWTENRGLTAGCSFPLSLGLCVVFVCLSLSLRLSWSTLLSSSLCHSCSAAPKSTLYHEFAPTWFLPRGLFLRQSVSACSGSSLAGVVVVSLILHIHFRLHTSCTHVCLQSVPIGFLAAPFRSPPHPKCWGCPRPCFKACQAVRFCPRTPGPRLCRRPLCSPQSSPDGLGPHRDKNLRS